MIELVKPKNVTHTIRVKLDDESYRLVDIIEEYRYFVDEYYVSFFFRDVDSEENVFAETYDDIITKLEERVGVVADEEDEEV